MKVLVFALSGMLLILAMGIVYAGTYSNNDTFLNVTKIIEPDIGDTFNVTLMVKNIQPITKIKYPVYVVLALDTSGTMKDTDRGFVKTKQAVKTLLNFFEEYQVEYKIAIVSWDSNVDYNTSFTENRQEIEASLEKLKADYTEPTKYDYAIIPSVKLFMNTPGIPENAKKFIIIVTDASGEFEEPSSEGKEYIEIANKTGVAIYIIAISPVKEAKEVFEEIARRTGGEVFSINLIDEATEKLKSIIFKEVSVPVKDIIVVDVIKGYFDVISTTIQPTEKEVGVDNKFVWKIDKLTSQETWKVKMFLKANLTNVPVEVSEATAEFSRIEYTNPDSNKREVLPIPAGKVEIRTGAPAEPLKYQLISVDSMLSPPNPKIGSEAVVNAIVRNVGMVEANNVKVTLYEDEKPIDAKIIEKLGPGEVKVEKFRWIAKDANLTVRVTNGFSPTLNSTSTPVKSPNVPGFEITFLLIAMVVVLVLVSKKKKFK